MVAASIARWGDEAQCRAWLPAMATGKAIGALALSEPGHGSDAAAIETEIEPTGETLLVSGRKAWVTGGQVATLFLVFGRIGDRHAAILVPDRAEGFARRPSPPLHGFRGAMIADLELDRVALAASSRIGPISDQFSFVAAHALELGRLLVAWGAVGMVETLLSRALDHGGRRSQFGRPIVQHQLIQRRLADMAAGLRAASLLCESASRMRIAGDHRAMLELLYAKYVATRVARDAAQSTAQILGAAGLVEGEPAERFLRDAAVQELIESSTEICQILIAGNAGFAL
jgi:alkylation response protein AidB-like acyl-CoA dehydrogenase